MFVKMVPELICEGAVMLGIFTSSLVFIKKGIRYNAVWFEDGIWADIWECSNVWYLYK